MITENSIKITRTNINALKNAETFVVRKNEGHTLAAIELDVKTSAGKARISIDIECDKRITKAFSYDPHLSVAETNTAKFLGHSLKVGDTLELFAHINNSSEFTKQRGLIRDELYLLIYRKGKRIGSVMVDTSTVDGVDNINRVVQ